MRGWAVAVAPTHASSGTRVGASHAVHIVGDAARRRQERSRSHEGLVAAIVEQFAPRLIMESPRPRYGDELAATVARLVAEFGT